ncbi:WxL domain-containing protein [Vagococcus sp. DIV0080]|uniref:WxL domain-containing protein n=1 Tax=Candidatus Vagococcus giribetii TaxID=2230876 RepID=A0ABS3HUA8_9ENTE|nr:WxL domain-containing protein [Vagococcus sp. DIV0080]MBO0477327.1 WxL domain-containing protein [Vagococcus sp. DIV0080]
MRKKKKSLFLLGTVCMLFSVQGPVTSAVTSGSVGLKGNTQPDIAVDPKDDQEIDNDKVPTEGPYSLSYVSDLSFGKHVIPEKETSYFAHNDVVKIKETQKEKEVQNFIQISDMSGSQSGWKLYVSSSDTLSSGKSSIDGVSYSFNHIIVRPILSDHNEFQLSDNLYTPSQPIKIVSSSNQQTLIAEAKGIEGQGRWHVLFGNNLNEGNKSISMTVPKGAVKEAGVYRSTLVWDFTNAK